MGMVLDTCHVSVTCQLAIILRIVKPKSEVQSPKVKTERTWADTKMRLFS